MTVSKINFYECDNPECGLRFPVNEDIPKSLRCPVCRSTIHIAASVLNSIESSNPAPGINGWNVGALLDNVRSAWNVGSIFRTSEGTGVQRIYLCGITPTPENKNVGKTALGAELSIPWQKSYNAIQLVRSLLSEGYLLWALEDLPNAVPLYQISDEPIISPIVIIVGNELCGVDPGIIELCNKVISIPMMGKKKSYNVAVAYGMAVNFLLYRHSVSQGSRNILPST
jgi:23S rRNA (guanosine2251-2'-O)-methyltransferase